MSQNPFFIGLELTFAGSQKPCFFNTGLMVIDLERWRDAGKIEEWMELQKRIWIHELGSLSPFLLVFSRNIAPVDHRWNQHGLGGDKFFSVFGREMALQLLPGECDCGGDRTKV